jgi:hypothetical protein
VTAEHLEVHSLSLLLIIKVCFLIHGASAPKTTNEVTAKASLTQMINLIFSRMERFASLLFPGTVSDIGTGETAGLTSSESDISVKQVQEAELVTSSSLPPPVAIEDDIKDVDDCKLKKMEQLKLDVSLVLNFLCRCGIVSETSEDETSSVHSFTPDVISPDELNASCINVRTLALELLLSVLNNVGPSFRHEDLFFKVVKEHLLLVVSKNSVTTNPVLFELSISIFLLVIRFFRHKLKLEVEMQFVLYLQILEMGNSTYKQKSQILQALLLICENPQVLVLN